jgi:hypothetical protein
MQTKGPQREEKGKIKGADAEAAQIKGPQWVAKAQDLC